MVSLIKAHPVYAPLEGPHLVEEVTAHIIGSLAGGHIRVYRQPGKLDLRNVQSEPIKVSDVDMLIKYGFLPIEFQVLSTELERFQPNDGNVDGRYLRRIYLPSREEGWEEILKETCL